MMEFGGYFWDFEKMEAYRWTDYHNFNIGRKECAIKLKLINGKICDYDMYAGKWRLFGNSAPLERMIDQAYKKWLDEEIDKIVL
jgi:hypothetical protein